MSKMGNPAGKIAAVVAIFAVGGGVVCFSGCRRFGKILRRAKVGAGVGYDDADQDRQDIGCFFNHFKLLRSIIQAAVFYFKFGKLTTQI